MGSGGFRSRWVIGSWGWGVWGGERGGSVGWVGGGKVGLWEAVKCIKLHWAHWKSEQDWTIFKGVLNTANMYINLFVGWLESSTLSHLFFSGFPRIIICLVQRFYISGQMGSPTLCRDCLNCTFEVNQDDKSFRQWQKTRKAKYHTSAQGGQVWI